MKITALLIFVILFGNYLSFANNLSLRPDTVFIYKMTSETTRRNAEMPKPDEPHTRGDYPPDYKNGIVKVGDIIVYYDYVLPSADIHVRYEIGTPDLIVFIGSDSRNDYYKYSNGSDGAMVWYYFKAVKAGKGELYLEKTQYREAIEKVKVVVEIVDE